MGPIDNNDKDGRYLGDMFAGGEESGAPEGVAGEDNSLDQMTKYVIGVVIVLILAGLILKDKLCPKPKAEEIEEEEDVAAKDSSDDEDKSEDENENESENESEDGSEDD